MQGQPPKFSMVNAKPGMDFGESSDDPEDQESYREARESYTPTILGSNYGCHKRFGHPGAKLLWAFFFTLIWVLFGSVVFQWLEHEDMVKWQAGNHNFEDVLLTMRNITDAGIAGQPFTLTPDQVARMQHATNFMSRNKPAHVGMSIEGGFFFSVLSLTTIGYGRFLIPRTMWGRLFVIPYTLIGIPLLGIMYTVWAKVALAKIKLWLQWLKGSRARKWQTTLVAMVILMMCVLGVGPLLFMAVEEWEYYEAVYFVWVTVSTIGYGDFVPETDRGEWLGIILVPMGLGVVALVFAAITQWFEDMFVFFDYDEEYFRKTLEARAMSPRLKGSYGSLDDTSPPHQSLVDPSAGSEPTSSDPLLGETSKDDETDKGKGGGGGTSTGSLDKDVEKADTGQP